MDTEPKKKGLFLDDLRNPEDVTWVTLPNDVNWKIVRSFHEFAETIENEDFDVISFDHYLGENVYLTGRDCLQHLITNLTLFNKQSPKEVCFHSSDPECNQVSKKIWDTHRLSQELVKATSLLNANHRRIEQEQRPSKDELRKERNRRKKERQKAKRR